MMMVVPSLDTSTVALSRGQTVSKRSGFWIIALYVSIIIPFVLQIGPFHMSATRLVLTLMFVPCFVLWLFGAVGQWRAVDIFLLFFSLWCVVSFVVLLGFNQALEPAGMWIIETFGSYLMGRCLVRDERTFRIFVRSLVGVVLVLLPFVALESFLNRPVYIDLMSKIYMTVGVNEMEMRWSLRRAQGAFEHPILYGSFCASAFALAFYAYARHQSFFGRYGRALGITAATFFSLSAGAFLALAVQGVLIAWELLTRTIRRRWLVFGAIIVVVYIIIDLLSNRTPLQVFISYLTFSTGNAVTRVITWEWGTKQVMLTPIFGIGFSDQWARPYNLPPSVDNFWLLMAMRHGLPAIICLGLSVLTLCWGVSRAKLSNLDIAHCRTGYLISVIGLFAALTTVHLWNNSYVHVMFLMGAGVWFMQVKPETATDAAETGKDSKPRARRQAPDRPRLARPVDGPRFWTGAPPQRVEPSAGSDI